MADVGEAVDDSTDGEDDQVVAQRPHEALQIEVAHFKLNQAEPRTEVLPAFQLLMLCCA